MKENRKWQVILCHGIAAASILFGIMQAFRCAIATELGPQMVRAIWSQTYFIIAILMEVAAMNIRNNW
jgi:hypothetical protein